MSQQYRNYLFTDFKNENLNHLKELKGLKYLYAQREACPTTGRHHWQGYILFNSPKRVATMRKQGQGGHMIVMSGTPQSNDDYCTKEATSILDDDGNHLKIEHGTKPDMNVKQGQRTDLLDIQIQILEGDTMEQVADQNFEHWCRYNKAFEKYALMKTEKRKFKTNVYYYVGASGTGKSRLASELAINPYYKNTGKWWDGYDGTSDIIIDDFTGNIPFTELLRLTDRYPHQVETKGGMINFAPRNIYITSNICWKRLYLEHIQKHPGHVDALLRRITQNIIFDTSTYGVQKKKLQQEKDLQEKACIQEVDYQEGDQRGGQA